MIRVVSIDDNQEVRENFKEYFKNTAGIEFVGEAENGEEGYELIKSKKPDVVILDIVMPKMDGLGLLEKLSKDSLSPHIIMYSAIGNDTVVQKTSVVKETLLNDNVLCHRAFAPIYLGVDIDSGKRNVLKRTVLYGNVPGLY